MREGKPDYGKLGNWAIEEFQIEDEEDIFEIEEERREMNRKRL